MLHGCEGAFYLARVDVEHVVVPAVELDAKLFRAGEGAHIAEEIAAHAFKFRPLAAAVHHGGGSIRSALLRLGKHSARIVAHAHPAARNGVFTHGAFYGGEDIAVIYGLTHSRYFCRLEHPFAHGSAPGIARALLAARKLNIVDKDVLVKLEREGLAQRERAAQAAKLEEQRKLQEVYEFAKSRGISTAQLYKLLPQSDVPADADDKAVRRLPPKYRFVDGGSTYFWCGKGFLPTWLKRQEAQGRNRMEFRIGEDGLTPYERSH